VPSIAVLCYDCCFVLCVCVCVCLSLSLCIFLSISCALSKMKNGNKPNLKHVIHCLYQASFLPSFLPSFIPIYGRVELLSKSDTIPTVVMGMEILDNLPHDKIRRKNSSSISIGDSTTSSSNSSSSSSSSSRTISTNKTIKKDRKPIEQAEIHWNVSLSKYEEVFVPLSDPLLERTIKAVPSYVQPYPCWIPTVACGVLHHVIQQRGSMVSIVLADFDWLPESDVRYDVNNNTNSNNNNNNSNRPQSAYAEGEPIVTDMSGIDHECYLSAPSHCDILFPTDFDKLASFVRRALSSTRNTIQGSNGEHHDNHTNNNNNNGTIHRPRRMSTVLVEKQSDFLQRVGPRHVKSTKSWLTGHTPLLHDFVNCSVLTVTHEEGVEQIARSNPKHC
jgi:hypothetical protein